MPKKRLSRAGFTLIEVMVAVMIVSVVIAALLQMQGNASHKLFEIQKMMQSNQESSFLLSNSEKYGFEESKVDMKDLLEDFELESDLRRHLSSIMVTVTYETLEVIDTNEMLEDKSENLEEENYTSEDAGSSGILFEIGETSLVTKDASNSLLRVRLQ